MKPGWEVRPLVEVCDIVGGGTPSKRVQSYYGGDIPWATVRDMNVENLQQTEHTLTIDGLENSSSKVIPKGEVIIATRVGLGKVCVLGQDTAINQDLRGIIPRDPNRIHRRYLFYWFQSISEQIVGAGSGATVQGVKLTFVKGLRIPLPPLEEQRRIVAVLDEAFEGLARARENTEANLADTLHIGTRALDDAIGQLSARNGRTSIGEIATVKGGKRLPKGERLSSQPTPFPYVSVKDFTDEGTVSTERLGYISAEIQETIKRYTISTRDVYVSIAGTIGKTGIVPLELEGANLTENAAKLVLHEGWSNEYVYWCTRSSDFAEQAVAQTRIAAQPKLALQRLAAISIPVANADEQLDLCRKMAAFRARRAEILVRYEAKLTDINDLRQSLLQKAFAGELT